MFGSTRTIWKLRYQPPLRRTREEVIRAKKWKRLVKAILNSYMAFMNDDFARLRGNHQDQLHNLILRGIMDAGFLDARGVKRLFHESFHMLKWGEDIIAELVSPEFIQTIVRQINSRIQIYDMMIRSATCEITGEKFYMFLHTADKHVERMHTYLTKTELDLFQRIVSGVVQTSKSSNFAISKEECISILGEQESQTLTKEEAEEFIDNLISMNYFTKLYKDEEKTEYEITLGFRTIREFDEILRDVYSDYFENCVLCKMILLNGVHCPHCYAVMHRGCVKKYLRTCKKCEMCDQRWTKDQPFIVRTRDGPSMDESIAVRQYANFYAYDGNNDADVPAQEPELAMLEHDIPPMLEPHAPVPDIRPPSPDIQENDEIEPDFPVNEVMYESGSDSE